jgi:hypothetical protein
MTFSRNAEIYGEIEPAIMFTRLSAGVQTCNFRRPAPDWRLPFSGEVFGLELGAHQQFSGEAIDKCAERHGRPWRRRQRHGRCGFGHQAALVNRRTDLAAAKDRKSACAVPTAHCDRSNRDVDVELKRSQLIFRHSPELAELLCRRRVRYPVLRDRETSSRTSARPRRYGS